MYKIKINGIKVKTYKIRLQCVIWAILHGYVNLGDRGGFLQNCVSIQKVSKYPKS